MSDSAKQAQVQSEKRYSGTTKVVLLRASFVGKDAHAGERETMKNTVMHSNEPRWQLSVSMACEQSLRVRLAFGGDPGSEGGRGPEVLLSRLPRWRKPDYTRAPGVTPIQAQRAHLDTAPFCGPMTPLGR